MTSCLLKRVHLNFEICLLHCLQWPTILCMCVCRNGAYFMFLTISVAFVSLSGKRLRASLYFPASTGQYNARERPRDVLHLGWPAVICDCYGSNFTTNPKLFQIMKNISVNTTQDQLIFLDNTDFMWIKHIWDWDVFNVLLFLSHCVDGFIWHSPLVVIYSL